MSTKAKLRAEQIFEGLNAYERNCVAIQGTAFTTYEDEGDEVCALLEALAKAWTSKNYTPEGIWCGEGCPP